jgi:hypothetical protein
MKNIFFFITFLFPYTNQFLCSTRCRIFQITKGESFQDVTPSDSNKCRYDYQAKRCYGRIMAYYNQTSIPEYISYSLGTQGHIIEKEIEELANKNALKSIIYFLFLTESFHTNEVIITAYILCQTSDNCALKYIKEFFYLYQNQTNPTNEFSSFLVSNDTISKLNCYDYEAKQIKECLPIQYSRCILHDNDVFQQGCSSDPETKLEYAFIITPSKNNLVEKIYELLLCNKDTCNDKSVMNIIENMIYSSTFGKIVLVNHSNRIQLQIVLLFIVQILFYDI